MNCYSLSMLRNILNTVNIDMVSNRFPPNNNTFLVINNACKVWFKDGYAPKELEKYVIYRFDMGLSVDNISKTMQVTNAKVSRSLNLFVKNVRWVLRDSIASGVYKRLVSEFPEILYMPKVCKALHSFNILDTYDMAFCDFDAILKSKRFSSKDKSKLKEIRSICERKYN